MSENIGVKRKLLVKKSSNSFWLGQPLEGGGGDGYGSKLQKVIMTGKDIEQVAHYVNEQGSPLTDFELNCLERHNHYRQLHHVKPLKIDPELSHHAQNWADYLIEKRSLCHREDISFGENLFALYSNYDVSGGAEIKAVDSWYDECATYFSNSDLSNIENFGHFTQLVWKETSHVGIGKSSQRGLCVIVANYNPPGNIIGEFDENVLSINN